MTFFLLMMLCGMAVPGCAGTESENTVKEESSVISIPIIFTVGTVRRERRTIRSLPMRLIKPMQESITWMWNGYLKRRRNTGRISEE